MKVQYVDFETVEKKVIECNQVNFVLDKENLLCFNNTNDTIDDAIKIPKKYIQLIYN